MRRQPQLAVIDARCDKCGRCYEACPKRSLVENKDGIPRPDATRCDGCGECAAVCRSEALLIYGKGVTDEEVFGIVSRDRVYYEESGGGITASGGEPLLQPTFLEGLFARCHNEGISTAIETAGFVGKEALLRVLRHTDYVFYDLKHMDEAAHKRLTGASNRRVLSNAEIVAGSGVGVQFRMPVIPGHNDSEDNISRVASFLRTLQKDSANIEILGYHRLGSGKYPALDMPYPLHEVKSPDRAAMEQVRCSFERHGVRCKISE